MSRWRSERGAAAVEFALVVPLLLVILLGIIEFGRVYNIQISLTHAARETARAMAVQSGSNSVADPWTLAVQAGKAAAPSIDSGNMTFTPSLASCSVGSTFEVSIAYPYAALTGIIDDLTLEGKAAMRCGG